jgi:hypothetical protein
LLIRRPDLVPALLAGLGVRLPPYTIVRAAQPDPAAAGMPRRADVVLQQQWAPMLGIVVELPQGIDDEDWQRWPRHLASLRRREQCAVELLVVTPDESVATWAGQPFQLGERRVIPHVLHLPPMLSEKRAFRDPTLAMLCAVMHADDPDEGRALALARLAQRAILGALSDEEAGWYLGIIRESVPASRREKLITPIVCPYDREPSRQHFTLGVASALLDKLVRRHGAPPPGVTEHVLTMSLEELSRLRHRLATSQSLEEALAVPPAGLADRQGTAAQLVEELARAREPRIGRWRWCWPWSRTA